MTLLFRSPPPGWRSCVSAGIPRGLMLSGSLPALFSSPERTVPVNPGSPKRRGRQQGCGLSPAPSAHPIGAPRVWHSLCFVLGRFISYRDSCVSSALGPEPCLSRSLCRGSASSAAHQQEPETCQKSEQEKSVFNSNNAEAFQA